MTDQHSTDTSGPGGPGREPTEEEMRAALEAEMQRVTPDDLLLQTVVSLLNLGARRMGLAPGVEDELNLDHAQTCIDGVRALLPLLDARHGEQLKPIRDAVSQLQMAYAQARGGAEAPTAPGGAGSGGGAPGEGPPGGGAAPGEQPPDGPEAPPGGEPGGQPGREKRGPAQQSGRLWIPGQ